MIIKRNKFAKVIGAISLCLIMNISVVDAHSGRTDSNGGHRDNKNVSGLGSYHYHHGYGPHLHTNGCPYGGGTTNGSGGVSGLSTVNTEEKEKESARTKGYNDGYNAGYAGQLSNNSYSGNYSDLYSSKYSEGYTEGTKKLESEKDEANSKGFEIGATGATIDTSIYSNEELKKAYHEGYNKGIKEYKDNKIKEYSAIGLKDGKEDKPSINLENIDVAFKRAYQEAYDKGQVILSETYMEQGYKDAFKSTEYKSPAYENNKYNNWYKEGFDKGIKDIEHLKEVGYSDGYNRNEQRVPEGLGYGKGLYNHYYAKGEEVADKEAKEATMTFSGVAVAGWLLRRFLVAKKSIM